VTGILARDRIRAICFDIDGTLADTDDSYIRRLADLLTPLRALLPQRDPHSAARRLVMALETPANMFIATLDRLGLDQIIGPLINLLYQLRGAKPARGMRLIDGARQAVTSLAVHYPLAIATARERSSAFSFLHEHALDPYFVCVATARSARRAKPHPGPIIWVCEQLSLEPEALLMVGDTVVDIRAARAAGAQTVGVLSGFGTREELQEAGADAILGTIAELVPTLLPSLASPTAPG